jgi:hypothetical protein
MHLFILKEVLFDYTSGMAVIVAENMDQCRDLFIKEFGEYYADEFDNCAEFTILDSVGDREAGVIQYVYGGG